MSNPCLSCGACCAYFRASFHWLETAPCGITPAELTIRISPQHVAMRGTEQQPPRCTALEGEIGSAVRCSIYALRASPCREFQASWVNGVHNVRCDRARSAHGLPPLLPEAHAKAIPAQAVEELPAAIFADMEGAGERPRIPAP
jgi:Fe-S-cluster containining protein